MLTAREKLVIEASVYPMIKDLNVDQFRKPLVDAIAQMLFIKQNNDVGPDAQKEMADYVAKVLKESFTTYRITEILHAIELWARGELFRDGDMNVPSPENIFKAIHRYNEIVRRPAIEKQKKHEEKLAKEAEEMQRQDKLKTFEDVIVGKYHGFPDTFKNESKGALAAMYRHLDKKGLILLSVETKKNIFNQILKIKDRVKWMRKPLIELTAKELAEYRALKVVFKDWKDMQINLREELENKPQ